MSTQSDFKALVAALEAKDHCQVSESVAAIIKSAPVIGDRWVQLARAASSIGELDLANAALALRVRQSPQDMAAKFDQIAMLAQTNRAHDASAALASLPETVPDRSAHWYLRGTLALNLGDFDFARAAFEQAISYHPTSGQALLALAAAGSDDAKDALVSRLEALAAAMERQPDLERACYHYALCKAYADQNEYRSAFEHAGEAGKLCRNERPYHASRDGAHAHGIIKNYTPKAMEQLRSRCAEPAIAPVFVLGLPRSGTTLLQQILASHSTMADGGELGRIPVMIKRMGGAAPAQILDYADRNPNLLPANLYAHLARQYDPGDGTILDKSIENTRYLGIIKALMPNSKIIWIRRDPLASAWSTFSNYFTRSLNWSFDLNDIGDHHAIEQQLHEHWTAMFDNDLLTVTYEDLVSQNGPTVRQILQHCNLAEEDGPLEHHRNNNTIATASAVQARKPIYQSSISGAEPYREFMQPYFASFERQLSRLKTPMSN